MTSGTPSIQSACAQKAPVPASGGESAGRFERAARAQRSWAALPLHHRLMVIWRFRKLLADNATKLALAAIHGSERPLSEALAAQVLPLAEAARFLESEAVPLLTSRQANPQLRPAWLRGTETEILREPLGVVLLIAPANYPLLLPGVQLLQALTAGNAVLLKPGLHGSPAANALASLLQTAGLPADLLHVLPETTAAAREALALPVSKVFFTGSFATGTAVLAQLAGRAIPATMELSGSDAVIVRADADLDLTVRGLLFGLRLNGSATCIAPRRVFVARRVVEQLEARLQSAVARENTRLVHDARLAELLSEARQQGASLLAGSVDSTGRLQLPVLVTGAETRMRLLQEDFFAPVLSLVTVEDDTEAVQRANECPFALGATIFSKDVRAAKALAEQLPAGVVLINDVIVPTADPRVPFGGRRQSGFGVTRGAEGLLEMTVTKVVIHRRGRFRPHFDAPAPGDEELFRAYIEAAHGGGWLRRLHAAGRLIAGLVRKSTRPARPGANLP